MVRKAELIEVDPDNPDTARQWEIRAPDGTVLAIKRRPKIKPLPPPHPRKPPASSSRRSWRDYHELRRDVIQDHGARDLSPRPLLHVQARCNGDEWTGKVNVQQKSKKGACSADVAPAGFHGHGKLHGSVN